MTPPPGSTPPAHPDDRGHPVGGHTVSSEKQAYWRATISLILTLLAIWFVVAYLLGIVFAPALSGIKLGEAPLGFWIAHNGAIYVFIGLIVYYAKRMGDLDKKFGVQE